MLFYWDNTEKLPYNTEDSYQWNRHINFPFKLLLHWTIFIEHWTSFNVIKPPYNHHKNHALNIWHKFILVYFFTSTSTCLYYIYSVVQRWNSRQLIRGISLYSYTELIWLQNSHNRLTQIYACKHICTTVMM